MHWLAAVDHSGGGGRGDGEREHACHQQVPNGGNAIECIELGGGSERGVASGVHWRTAERAAAWDRYRTHA